MRARQNSSTVICSPGSTALRVKANAPINIGAFQPFGILQLGGGHYLRSTGIWVYNFENDNYSMPIGLGYGKVFKIRNTVYNAFIEPQYSVADSGPGQPEWQVFVGLNMQFTGL